MAKEELAAQLPKPVDTRLYNYVLRQLNDSDLVAQEMEWVRLASHKVDLSAEEEVIRQKIESVYLESNLQTPFFKEVAPRLPGTARQHQDVLAWMFSQGTLVKVKEDILFHSATQDALQKRLVAYLKEHGEISTPEFKEMTQTSRKYTILLLEYFDAQKVTIRVGG